MKIAIFVPAWPPGLTANGIVTYASHLVPALRRLGHEVFVITPNKKLADDDPYTIDLHSFSSPPSVISQAMWNLAPATANFEATASPIARAIQYLIEKHKINVFEIEESFGWSFAVSRLNLLPVVVRLHGPWFLYNRFGDLEDASAINRRRQKWEGRGIKHAQFVTANCMETLQAAKTFYDLNLTRARVIPTPINAAPQTETWNLTTCNENSLLFVGRFDRLKGGDLVVRAFAQLAESNQQLHLTFIGPDKGIKEADGSIYDFNHFVRANFPEWFRSRIEFRGLMTHADVMSLRTKHFATIIAAQYDTMGYMLLEPMSLGCPLVATAVGGIPEVIENQRNGLLVPSQDVNAMASACRTLLNDPTLAVRLGRQAWLDCRDLYSPDTVANQTAAVYEEAIKEFENPVISRLID